MLEILSKDYHLKSEITPPSSLPGELIAMVLALYHYAVCREIVKAAKPVEVWAHHREDCLVLFLTLIYLGEPAESWVPSIVIFIYATLGLFIAICEIKERNKKLKGEEKKNDRGGSS